MPSWQSWTTTSAWRWLTVDDVESKYRELSGRGVKFEKDPQRLPWGYGAELRDPDGDLVYIWDEARARPRASYGITLRA
jgi:predicted enzyme related to lactoylglutathione lyase